MIKWLNQKLRAEIRDTFEPLYGKNVSDKEIESIAENLTSFLEVIIDNKHENEINRQQNSIQE